MANQKRKVNALHPSPSWFGYGFCLPINKRAIEPPLLARGSVGVAADDLSALRARKARVGPWIHEVFDEPHAAVTKPRVHAPG